MTQTHVLHWGDVVVCISYFAIILAVGIWASLRASRASVSGYFLAGRDMHWSLVGASLFASNIGSGHFVGLAGTGAAAGIAVAGFELNAVFVLMLLGWLFVPVYIASGVYTMPEYLSKRFGGKRIRVYLAVLALLLYAFTKISVDLFAGALFIEQSLGWNLWASVSALLAISCLFTVLGGLSAVIWTDTIQVVIMLNGAFILMCISFYKVGGYSEMVTKYKASLPPIEYTLNHTDCRGETREDAMNLWRSATEGDLPWTGMLFGLTISSIWYWCSDQVIVQRTLAAKNFTHAKAGCVFAATLKFLPMWLLIFPGMIARILFPEIACTNPDKCMELCGIATGCSNIAYPKLVLNIMPAGLKGLMLSCMLSALMSSLTSIFNSSSTIFTIDIWKLFRPLATEIEQLVVGKAFTVFLVLFGLLWVPIIQNYPGSQLFDYLQSVTSCLAPPICAVYVLAIFWPRTNEPGAFYGLMAGLVVGMIRFILEIVSAGNSPRCDEEDTRSPVLTKVHYLHFGCILFVIVMFVTAGVSLLFPPIEEKHLYRLTFWTRHSKEERIELIVEEESKRLLKKELALNSAEVSATTEPTEGETLPLGKRVANCILGVQDHARKLSAAEQQQIESDMISLDENPMWANLTNGLAIFVMCIAVVFYTVWG